ncbi:hypothetical protein DB88DRAFT_548247 [Papiliotrema laurentii]|uniref:Uncharacterized protein n=1 Tax=Papiliotrema laurentii TaxID=5418 RepID=A0AAD9CZ94_PAPLA|nr:hypothetical protein DB88DRAFT_548247 [Papiliotrema laurentii]
MSNSQGGLRRAVLENNARISAASSQGGPFRWPPGRRPGTGSSSSPSDTPSKARLALQWAAQFGAVKGHLSLVKTQLQDLSVPSDFQQEQNALKAEFLTVIEETTTLLDLVTAEGSCDEHGYSHAKFNDAKDYWILRSKIFSKGIEPVKLFLEAQPQKLTYADMTAKVHKLEDLIKETNGSIATLDMWAIKNNRWDDDRDCGSRGVGSTQSLSTHCPAPSIHPVQQGGSGGDVSAASQPYPVGSFNQAPRENSSGDSFVPDPEVWDLLDLGNP